MPYDDIGVTLQCDGTQDGLLTALFYAEAARPRAAAILMGTPLQTDLLLRPAILPTEQDKADRVRKAVRRKLPGEAYWVFESVHASCLEDRGTVIMRYLRLGWQVGKKLNDYIAHPDVFRAVDISRNVGHEIHKLTGLARFRAVRGVYYCPLTPDHDVIEFLAPHFADRLSDQNFIIHDLAREKAVVYNAEKMYWMALPLEKSAVSDAPHDPYVDLWQAYHSAIAIEVRKNPALQRQHMPRRYWKFLPEMQQHSHK